MNDILDSKAELRADGTELFRVHGPRAGERGAVGTLDFYIQAVGSPTGITAEQRHRNVPCVIKRRDGMTGGWVVFAQYSTLTQARAELKELCDDLIAYEATRPFARPLGRLARKLFRRP